MENNQIVSFDDEKLILVNENDQIIGYETKAVCHQGDGILHRAFSIFIFNSRGELLLQQRSEQKTLWGLYWSNTCCSHPRQGENMEEATQRRLFEELGIRAPLSFLYKFQYHAPFDNIGSERELCWVFAGHSDDAPKCNPNEIKAVRYVAIEELDEELAATPEKFTPWFKMEWQRLRKDFMNQIRGLITHS